VENRPKPAREPFREHVAGPRSCDERSVESIRDFRRLVLFAYAKDFAEFLFNRVRLARPDSSSNSFSSSSRAISRKTAAEGLGLRRIEAGWAFTRNSSWILKRELLISSRIWLR